MIAMDYANFKECLHLYPYNLINFNNNTFLCLDFEYYC